MRIAKLWALLPDSQADMAFSLGSCCRDQRREVQSPFQPTHMGSTRLIPQLAALGGVAKCIILTRSGVCRAFVHRLNSISPIIPYVLRHPCADNAVSYNVTHPLSHTKRAHFTPQTIFTHTFYIVVQSQWFFDISSWWLSFCAFNCKTSTNRFCHFFFQTVGQRLV